MSEQLWLECCNDLLHGEYNWPEHGLICSGKREHGGQYAPTDNYGKPVWRGEAERITLLINADFGMGDTIQFWRFVQSAKDRVARVILRADEDFKPLFRDVEVIGKEEDLPQFDKIIHMMALTHVLGIGGNISGKPYIQIGPAPRHMDWIRFESLMRLGRFSKIGICWECNPFGPAAELKHIPQPVWQQFKHLLPDQMRFFSLNKLGCNVDGFLDMRPYMRDWNYTANLLQLLDLVISVDTAVAHLAGALGRAVWLLKTNEYDDWRWGLEGSRTVWYDTMSIFRKKTDWVEVVGRVARRLLEEHSDNWVLPPKG